MRGGKGEDGARAGGEKSKAGEASPKNRSEAVASSGTWAIRPGTHVPMGPLIGR